MSEYVEKVIARAEICQATGELPYPMCHLPLPLRAVAIIVSDKMEEQHRRN